MKITAEFNSTEELLSFISTFGTKSAVQLEGAKVGTKSKEIKVQPTKEEVKEITPVVEQEITEVTEVTEEVKVTKEQVRDVFAKLIKSGKQKEAKELTNKYGANKLPDVKEEDYAAILKEAEELV